MRSFVALVASYHLRIGAGRVVVERGSVSRNRGEIARVQIALGEGWVIDRRIAVLVAKRDERTGCRCARIR
jgi:hypothetical protein